MPFIYKKFDDSVLNQKYRASTTNLDEMKIWAITSAYKIRHAMVAVVSASQILLGGSSIIKVIVRLNLQTVNFDQIRP